MFHLIRKELTSSKIMFQWTELQIEALVVRTFSGRFVGAPPKIQSNLYRSWPAVHITNGQRLLQ